MFKEQFARDVADGKAIRLTDAKVQALQANAPNNPNLKGYRLVIRAGEVNAYPPKDVELLIFKVAIP